MIKTLVMMVSFLIGVIMTAILYVLEYSADWHYVIGYDSLYFTVLPLGIFLLLCVTPGEHGLREY